MPDEFVAELTGNNFLQSFDLLVTEFDYPTGLQVDQMVVVSTWHFLVTGAPIAEIVSCQNAGLFKQPHGPIHSGDADVWIDRSGSTIDLLDVRMVCGL